MVFILGAAIFTKSQEMAFLHKLIFMNNLKVSYVKFLELFS